jgi:hypothetical protein
LGVSGSTELAEVSAERSGLILSGAFYPDLKIGIWRRRMYQKSVIKNLSFEIV